MAHGVSQGFNGTIFAYGQTGSGKTYTMGGSTDTLSFTPTAAAAATAVGEEAGEELSPCSTNSSSVSCLLPAASDCSPTAATRPISVSPATLRMPPPPPPSQQLQQQGGQHPLSRPPGGSASERESATGDDEGGGDGDGCLGAEAGVIPRAVSTVLADAETRRSQGWEFVLTATYVEIYNEKIRDLLDPANDNLQVGLNWYSSVGVCVSSSYLFWRRRWYVHMYSSLYLALFHSSGYPVFVCVQQYAEVQVFWRLDL